MNMRTTLTLAAGVLALSSCALAPKPPTPPGPAPRTTYVLPDIPGIDDAQVFAPWNEMAGYPLVTNGPRPNVQLYVIPLIHDANNDPVVAFVNPGNPTIFYNPDYADEHTFQHELAHIIYGVTPNDDAGCDNPYRGVLSYCGYDTQEGWFGPEDQQLLATVL